MNMTHTEYIHTYKSCDVELVQPENRKQTIQEQINRAECTNIQQVRK